MVALQNISAILSEISATIRLPVKRDTLTCSTPSSATTTKTSSASWTKEEDDAVMAKLAVVQEKLAEQGRLGPVARLLPTTAATTLRKDASRRWCIDGPFAETKEQLLGFYVVDCDDLDEALDVARELGGGQSRRRL